MPIRPGSISLAKLRKSLLRANSNLPVARQDKGKALFNFPSARVGHVMRLLFASLLLLLIAAFVATPAQAANPSSPLRADCQFVLGFKTLRDLIGHEIVGECLENEHYNATGDSVQQTTGGLLVWRKADNWTAFTDGYRTWINGPNGLEQRLNTERFEWEPDYAPSGGIAGPSADPLIASVLQVMRTTPSGEETYQWYVSNDVRIAFGVLEEGVGSSSSDSEIILNSDEYGSSSLDEIAAALVANARSRRSDTAEDCLESIVQGRTARAQWWLERFGTYGKRNPTQSEEWINNDLARHLAGNLDNWIRSGDGFRSFCTQHYEGDLPPKPVPVHPTPVPKPMPEPQLTPAPEIPEQVGQVLQVLKTVPIGEILFDQFIEAGVTIGYEDLPGKVVAAFYRERNYIGVDWGDLGTESLDVVAAWVGHEIFHAVMHKERGHAQSEMECYFEEKNAFAVEVTWWRQKFGDNGLANPTTQSEKNLNYWLGLHLKDEASGFTTDYLLSFVQGIKEYQEYCAQYGAAAAPVLTPLPTPEPAQETPCTEQAMMIWFLREWGDIPVPEGTRVLWRQTMEAAIFVRDKFASLGYTIPAYYCEWVAGDMDFRLAELNALKPHLTDGERRYLLQLFSPGKYWQQYLEFGLRERGLLTD